MASCASCTYPLTIIDSIVCYECSSYFHIDCAQLVGFPYYEFSSDPSRNTFHCATCKILPLPRRRSESHSDSETEGDSVMPSRQLDYQLEGDVDLAKNLNEVQGSVQDLSDLCKDMLREINELKSINLTLRCCIENLRHDNENRDCVIAELKYRLDVLERNRTSERINAETSEWGENREGDVERYLTPEPEDNSKVEELSTSFSKAYIPDYRNDNFQIQDETLQRILPEEKVNDRGDEDEDVTNKTAEDLQDSGAITGTENDDQESETVPPEKEEPLYTEETFTFDVIKESKADELSDVEQRRKDWDWRGSKAVELEHLEDEESEEEESESESSQVEEGDNQGWEVLEEEIRSKTSSEPNKFDESGDDFWSSKKDEENQDVEEGEETETEDESWKEKCEMRDKKHVLEKDFDVEQKTSKEETESTYDSEAEEAADATRDQETPVPEETSEDGAEKKEGEGLGESEEGKLPEGVEGEITAEGAAVLEGEPRLDGDEEARLEGEGAPQPNTEDTPRLEGEQGVEGEQMGGQSPDGEVQPTEPQPPPPPVHTEEDLWLYLKETVTSVHPSTVEEFVQNLIGTLQHVPEEYLKPVIEANIKRAASPCVLDGEQPVAQEGTLLVEEGQEAPPDGSVPTESSESETAVAGEVSEVTTEVAGDAVVSEVPAEVPEEPATTEEVTDGFSIVEATA
ncbi:retinitis pigmentosa 1-like 1 protein isoform X1 [Homalodisca vitripennis]|uniref:retinitis pigmentosa 1-like 1 protein isoform X1 n=1 Tax=Homalodisca vitripennis TaxID=197043 RepID=UPI001EE9E8FF|nr:retinitis pigmentosa 1-like 1 protein isoform X1 [Homalodisca vitripennis]